MPRAVETDLPMARPARIPSALQRPARQLWGSWLGAHPDSPAGERACVSQGSRGKKAVVPGPTPTRPPDRNLAVQQGVPERVEAPARRTCHPGGEPGGSWALHCSSLGHCEKPTHQKGTRRRPQRHGGRAPTLRPQESRSLGSSRPQAHSDPLTLISAACGLAGASLTHPSGCLHGTCSSTNCGKHAGSLDGQGTEEETHRVAMGPAHGRIGSCPRSRADCMVSRDQNCCSPEGNVSGSDRSLRRRLTTHSKRRSFHKSKRRCFCGRPRVGCCKGASEPSVGP